MAIEHKTLPVGGVQFHPESLMSLGGEVGLRIVENAFRLGVASCIEEGTSLRDGDEAIQTCLHCSGLLRCARNDETLERDTDDIRT